MSELSFKDDEIDDDAWLEARALSLGIKDVKKAGTFVKALTSGAKGYEAAELAGYQAGPGAKTEEAKRNALAAQASRAKRGKKISRLLTEFMEHRFGRDDEVLGYDELLSSLSQEAKRGTGATKLLLEYHKQQPKNDATPEDAARILIQRLGVELAHQVCQRMWPAFVPAILKIGQQES